MFDKCILHIGTEKTGTTSIQAFLTENRAALLDRGFYVPTSMGPREHVGLVNLFADSRKVFSTRTTLGHHTVEKVENHKTVLGKRIHLEMEQAAQMGRTLVISAERFFTVISDDAEMEALHEFLYEYCKSVEIVAYVRPQHEFAVSMFSTNLKNGSRQKVVFQDLEKNKGMARKCDYAGVIEFWQKHFTEAEFKIRKFGRASLIDGDSVADFAHTIGVSTDGLEQPERRNESLNWKAQKFVLKMNVQMANTPKKHRPKKRAAIYRSLEKNFSGAGILPKRDDAVAFFEHFAASNERLRQAFFPEDDVLFDVSFEKYPLEAEQYKLTMGDAFDIFAKVIKDIQ